MFSFWSVFSQRPSTSFVLVSSGESNSLQVLSTICKLDSRAEYLHLYLIGQDNFLNLGVFSFRLEVVPIIDISGSNWSIICKYCMHSVPFMFVH